MNVFQFPAIMTHIRHKKNTVFYIVNILQLQALNISCEIFFQKQGQFTKYLHDQAWGRQQFHLELHQVQTPSICQNAQGSASGGKSEHAQTQSHWLTLTCTAIRHLQLCGGSEDTCLNIFPQCLWLCLRETILLRIQPWEGFSLINLGMGFFLVM